MVLLILLFFGAFMFFPFYYAILQSIKPMNEIFQYPPKFYVVHPTAENYLSEANMTLVADMLHISVSRVYSVATFYENFSLEPKGRHIIKVCDGTACHVRKSGPIYDAIHEYLKLEGKKKTSADGVFTLETVACLGACGLAPAMTIDGEVYAKMTPETALAELEAIRGKEAAE